MGYCQSCDAISLFDSEPVITEQLPAVTYSFLIHKLLTIKRNNE
jgi:hypothetical protein